MLSVYTANWFATTHSGYQSVPYPKLLLYLSLIFWHTHLPQTCPATLVEFPLMDCLFYILEICHPLVVPEVHYALKWWIEHLNPNLWFQPALAVTKLHHLDHPAQCQRLRNGQFPYTLCISESCVWLGLTIHHSKNCPKNWSSSDYFQNVFVALPVGTHPKCCTVPNWKLNMPSPTNSAQLDFDTSDNPTEG